MLCITNNSIKHKSFVYTQLNDQTVLFKKIQFSISTQFKCQSSIWPIDRTLSGTTTPGQSWPGTNGIWSLTIRFLSVISRTLVRGDVLPLWRDAVCLFCNPSWMVQKKRDFSTLKRKWEYLIYSLKSVRTYWCFHLRSYRRLICPNVHSFTSLYQPLWHTSNETWIPKI